MAMKKETIEHLANLARLRLSEEETRTFQDQIGSVLEYVEKLQQLDTKNVEPFAHAAGAVNVFRADEIEGCESTVRDRLIEQFPQREGDLLEVEAVFEERTE